MIAHGANPGLVSHFVKQALVNLASDTGVKVKTPTNRDGWGRLAQRLGVKVIHIAERDTQVSKMPKEVGEFVNTWSIDGFVSEGSQPAEMGWGTHEKALPPDGARHKFGCDAAIYLNRPGPAHARAHLDAARGAVPRLHHHPQRIDLDRRLLHAARRPARSSTGRPCTTPIIRATRRSCRCTRSPGRTCTSRRASA